MKEDVLYFIGIILFFLLLIAPAIFFSILIYLGKIIISPYYIWRYIKKKREAKRRRRNYEILGNYVALFGNNPQILKYFRELIEAGIKEKDFAELLEINLYNLQNFKKELLKKDFEYHKELKELLAEQKRILYQSKLSLEKIKFREKLLDSLYKKIEEKYKKKYQLDEDYTNNKKIKNNESLEEKNEKILIINNYKEDEKQNRKEE